jgi:Tol biopolymer transport system component/DNA-binding winged helix-turn-helix (wHTH) protein
VAETGEIYDFGPLRLDTRARQVYRQDGPVALTPKAYELLRILVENQGRAMSKTELQEALWPETHVEEGNLTFQISTLRKALGEPASHWIETVPRHGYRWNARPSANPRVDTRPRSLPKLGLYVAAGVVCIAVASGVYLSRSTEPKLTAAAPLTTLKGDELAPDLSPDGKSVLFAWNGAAGRNWDIYVKRIGEEEPVRLTDSDDVDFNPVWSPDGRQFAFARQIGPGTVDIILKGYPGGPERKLTQAASECLGIRAPLTKILDWPSEGQHLIVTGATGGQGCGLSSVAIGSGTTKPITEPPFPSVRDFAPALSPDGRMIAFTRGSDWPAFSIYVQPTSGALTPVGAPRRLAENGGPAAWPAWTADSQEVVFSNFLGGLFRVHAGRQSKAIAVPVTDKIAFHVSLGSGDTLVYATKPPTKSSLHRIEFDAHGRILSDTEIAPSTHFQQSPTYSPDNSKIAFESERSGSREIWVSSADGAQLRQVTRFGGPPAQSPRWSPDGTRLLFSAAHGDQREIYVADVYGGSLQRLTENTSDDAAASWSPDGKWIYFASNRSGRYEVWKMRIDGSEAVRLTTEGGHHPQASLDGRFVYFLEDGYISGLWRTSVEGGPAVRLAEGVLRSAGVRVGTDGVYYIVPLETVQPAVRYMLRRINPHSGVVSDVAMVHGTLGWGLSLSADSRKVLITRDIGGLFDLKIAQWVR